MCYFYTIKEANILFKVNEIFFHIESNSMKNYFNLLESSAFYTKTPLHTVLHFIGNEFSQSGWILVIKMTYTL